MARLSLDLLKERRDTTRIKMATYKEKVAQYYNRKVKKREFKKGDLVLRKAEVIVMHTLKDKFAPTWEGPYQVQEVSGNEAYRLQHPDGTPIPQTCNSNNLKIYHQ